MKLRLYHYWRSSSSWRVRWAFALKGIEYEAVDVNLLDDESEGTAHRARNPFGYVPVLEFVDSGLPPTPGGRFVGESLAIIHWAEETRPEPSLFPTDPIARAHVRQLAEIINAGTQPMQNLGVSALHSADPAEQARWNQHWIRKGLGAYEIIARETHGLYSVGDQLTLADLCLVPQCYNAGRSHVELGEFPVIRGIYEKARETRSCKASAPESYKPEA